MLLVVDANVVFSCLVKKGVTHRVFFLNSLSKKFEFIAPEYLWIEIGKEKEKLLKETKLSEEEVEEILNFLKEEVKIIPGSKYLHLLPKAEEFLKEHKKDSPYLALAFTCGIFSGDPKRIISS